ncbi:MAG: hypothetical protein ACTHLV_07770, partial [Achromobacter mucicolens]
LVGSNGRAAGPGNFLTARGSRGGGRRALDGRGALRDFAHGRFEVFGSDGLAWLDCDQSNSDSQARESGDYFFIHNSPCDSINDALCALNITQQAERKNARPARPNNRVRLRQT